MSDETLYHLETVNKADQTSTLMSIICDKLGLDPKKTTQTQLINTFTQAQADGMNSRETLKKLLSQ